MIIEGICMWEDFFSCIDVYGGVGEVAGRRG